MRDLLGREREALVAFLKVLETERSALESGALDRLDALAREKLACASTLSTLLDRRTAALAAARYGGDRAGMAAWIDASSDTGMRSLWQEVLDLTRRASELNEANGTLIRERLRHNQAALEVLMAATSKAALYGPDGQTSATGLTRPRDSA